MSGGADRALLAVPAEHPARRGRTVLYNGVDVGAALLTVVLLLTVLPLAGGGVLLALALMIIPQLIALFVYLSAMRRHGRMMRPPDSGPWHVA